MSEFRHGFADVNGVRLHYAEAGSGPLILFLHGFPEFWYAWRHQLAAFAGTHHVAAPDTRGINLSSAAPAIADYHVDRLSEDVIALARHLGHERFTLVGHDWGAIISWHTAIRFPGHVERLVIANVPHPGRYRELLHTSEAQRAASSYIHAFRSERGEELLSRDDFGGFRANIIDPLMAAGHMTAEDRDAYREAWARPGWLTAGLNYYRANEFKPPAADPKVAGPAPDFPPELYAVRAPTLLIWGERDPYMTTENLDGLERYVPDLRIRRFPDADHWVVHRKGPQVTALIRDFIDGRL